MRKLANTPEYPLKCGQKQNRQEHRSSVNLVQRQNKEQSSGLDRRILQAAMGKYIALDFSRILDDVNTPLSPAQLPD